MHQEGKDVVVWFWVFFFMHRSMKTWQPAVMGKIHNVIKLGNRHV